jgi:hypothetical protein
VNDRPSSPGPVSRPWIGWVTVSTAMPEAPTSLSVGANVTESPGRTVTVSSTGRTEPSPMSPATSTVTVAVSTTSPSTRTP